LAKARSSSRKLQVILRRVSALLLASHGSAYFCWCRTSSNPADAPSRRWRSLGKGRRGWKRVKK
jgi:hypothetical protein